MKTLYHATNPETVISHILAEGLKPGAMGCIFFCENEKDCLTYSLMYNPGKHEVAIIPIKFTDEEISKMEINIDNDARCTPKAYAYNGVIEKERVPGLLSIKKYVIESKD